MKIAIAPALALLAFAACKKDPLYCDANTPCTDPARPFCDHDGEYPASEGIKHTCIPDPNPDAGAGEDDAGGGAVRITQLTTGTGTSCALLSSGALRCWGAVQFGDEIIGDNEHPREAGDVPTGGAVAEVVAGDAFLCVRYDAGNVRCWGQSFEGQLGYGDLDDRRVTPDTLPDLELGEPATQIVAGRNHACALLESGAVRCWGDNANGQLGYGHAEDIGDNEVPANQDPVEVGGAVRQLALGNGQSCAVLESGQLRCWGQNSQGQLGYGNTEDRGDDELPSGYVNVGGDVESVALGPSHTCALLASGSVKCWGAVWGLGIPGSTEPVGDDEAPASIGNIDLGRPARQIIAGEFGTCAVLDNDTVECWGQDACEEGGLGYPNEPLFYVGDDETPAEQGPVVIGDGVEWLSNGVGVRNHSCAMLVSGEVRCWGYNSSAQLGLLHRESIGDDENPSTEDPVQILD